MAMKANEIKYLIEAAIPGAEVIIKDLVGDNNHYAVYVTSEAFRGKSRLQQHQMVYKALGDKMGNELHALSVNPSIPQESNN